MIDIEVSISARQIAKLGVQIAARQRTGQLAHAQKAARMMEQEVVSIIKAEMFWDRPPHRRHKGTIRLVNSFEGVVEESGNGFRAVLAVKPQADAAKIGALEFGAGAHDISGENGLRFPRGERGFTDPARNAYGKNNYFTPNPVYHPGRDGFHMMRRARERTMRKLGLR